VDFVVRPERPDDQPALDALMVELQEHIASLDVFGRNRPAAFFDVKAYFKNLRDEMQGGDGRLFVAESGGSIIGFVAGSITETSSRDLLEAFPSRDGKVHELIVASGERGKGIGARLMQEIERYFAEHGCSFVKVGCFAPNTSAHDFYEKCGFQDRYITMIKQSGVH
jgi:ribosomal protein S18 acetylase RimI-like enzyme